MRARSAEQANFWCGARRADAAGGTMLMALVTVAAGSIGLTAWLGVLTTRTHYAESMEETITRRVVLANSRAMAQEYVFRNVLTEASGPAASHAVTDSTDPDMVWGSFTMAEFSQAPLTSTTLTAGFNRFSPSQNNYGYFVPLEITVSDGEQDVPGRFYAKSRSPLLAGDVLTVSRSAAAPDHVIEIAADGPSRIDVDGRSFYQHPMNTHKYGNTTKVYTTRDVGASVLFAPSTPQGSPAPMSNFPSPPMTSGRTDVGNTVAALGFDGRVSVIDNALHPESLKARVLSDRYLTHQRVNGTTNFSRQGVSGSGNGVVDVNLNDPTLNNIFVEAGVTTINIYGQQTESELAAANSLPAIMLVVSQGATNLATVNFYHQSRRRLFVAIKNPSYATTTWNWMAANQASGVPTRLEYRLLLTTENTFVDFSFPGNVADVHIYGGVRNDRKIIAGGETEKMYIHPELINPGSSNTAAFAERYADRVAWLETYVP